MAVQRGGPGSGALTTLEALVASPCFWALVAMTGLQGAGLVVSGHRVGRSLPCVTAVLLLITAGRLVLPLSFVEQPRFETSATTIILGLVLLHAALAVGGPALHVRWWSAPGTDTTLRTTGVHGFVRHPIYLAEVLWPIGWSLLWGSTIGLALTPLWWLAFLAHALSEEQRLEQHLGQTYRDYKARVRGRLLPGLPI